MQHNCDGMGMTQRWSFADERVDSDNHRCRSEESMLMRQQSIIIKKGIGVTLKTCFLIQIISLINYMALDGLRWDTVYKIKSAICNAWQRIALQWWMVLVILLSLLLLLLGSHRQVSDHLRSSTVIRGDNSDHQQRLMSPSDVDHHQQTLINRRWSPPSDFDHHQQQMSPSSSNQLVLKHWITSRRKQMESLLNCEVLNTFPIRISHWIAIAFFAFRHFINIFYRLSSWVTFISEKATF